MKKIKKTARSCEQTVQYSICESPEMALQQIRQLNYVPVNVEITSTSKPLRTLDFSKLKKVTLIVGNEKHGVSEDFLKDVPLSCHIEMYGNNSSMNVSTSLAIATYKVSEDLFKLKNVLNEENNN